MVKKMTLFNPLFCGVPLQLQLVKTPIFSGTHVLMRVGICDFSDTL